MNFKISVVRASAAAVKYSIIFVLGIFGHSELVIDYGIVLAYSGLFSIMVSADLYYYFFKIRRCENEIDLRHFYIISILSLVCIAPLWIIKTGEAFYLMPVFIFSEILCIELQRYINVIKGTYFSANFIFTRSILSLFSAVALIMLDQITTGSLIAGLILSNLITMLIFIDKKIQFTNSKIVVPVGFIIAAMKGSIIFLIGSVTSRFVLLGDRLAIDFIVPTDVALESYINTVVIASMIGIIFEIFIGQFLIRTIFKDAKITLCMQHFLRIKRLILTFALLIMIASFPAYYVVHHIGIKISGLKIFIIVVVLQLVVIGLGVTQQLLYRIGKVFHRQILMTSIGLLSGTVASFLSLILHQKIFISLVMVFILSLMVIMFRLSIIKAFLRTKNEVF